MKTLTGFLAAFTLTGCVSVSPPASTQAIVTPNGAVCRPDSQRTPWITRLPKTAHPGQLLRLEGMGFTKACGLLSPAATISGNGTWTTSMALCPSDSVCVVVLPDELPTTPAATITLHFASGENPLSPPLDIHAVPTISPGAEDAEIVVTNTSGATLFVRGDFQGRLHTFARIPPTSLGAASEIKLHTPIRGVAGGLTLYFYDAQHLHTYGYLSVPNEGYTHIQVTLRQKTPTATPSCQMELR